MGASQVRWTLCCVVTVACFLYVTKGLQPLNDDVATWLQNLSPNHDGDGNLWKAYLQYMKGDHTKEGCYACSALPHSSHQPTFHVRPMTMNESRCAYNLSLGNPRHHFIECKDTPLQSLNWSMTTTLPTYWTSTPPDQRYPLCYIPSSTITYFTINSTTDDVTRTTIPAPGPFLGNTTGCDVTIDFLRYAALQPRSSSVSTVALTGAMWLCGRRLYPFLPHWWTGICAPVWVSDGSIFIHHDGSQTTLSSSSSKHLQRRRREVLDFAPHDSMTGSNVPRENRYWSAWNHALHSLFLWIGVTKVALYVETLSYRFHSYVNLSLVVDKGQNEEIAALKLMVLQNRVVLDLLTAAQGGTCALVGDKCCIYIPGENDTHIDEAMTSLKNLQAAHARDSTGMGSSLWDWLTSGPWWHLLLKICTPVLVVLFLFCLLFSCVVPCLKHMMMKAFSGVLFSLHQTHFDSYDEDYSQQKPVRNNV